MQIAVDRIVAEKLPSDVPLRSTSLIANWSEEDRAQLPKLGERVLHIEQRRAELRRREQAQRFKLSQAKQRWVDARERRRKVAIGEAPEGSDLPAMGDSEETEQDRLDAILKGLEDLNEEEKEVRGKLRGFVFDAQARADKEIYADLERTAKHLADLWHLLCGSQAFCARAGVPRDVVWMPAWRQIVIPAEKRLASGAREYMQAHSGDWLFYGDAVPPERASIIAARLQLDVDRLLPAGITIDWSRK